jgi:SAM-dependent methyltransferase
MEKDAEIFFQRLGIKPGKRLLDVGCGSGQLALIAARAGAEVTGCDISTNWLEKARARAASEKLNVTFEQGDAESLPYKDGQFDAVVSLIGAMFAPRPELVSAGSSVKCLKRSPNISHLPECPHRYFGETKILFAIVQSGKYVSY